MQDVANFFHVLVRAADCGTAGPNVSSVRLAGEEWVLRPWGDVPNEIAAQGYVCVSYVWGNGSESHPLLPSATVPVRARPVAETVIRTFKPAALWIDSLCVSPWGAARSACLRNFGMIYGNASKVVAVLSPQCAPALRLFARGDHRSLEPGPLELDDWVARAWTYQEIMNSRDIFFIAQEDDVSLAAAKFLDGLGHYMVDRESELAVDAFALKAELPRLDAMQDLLADWLMGTALERPAFSILSGMTARQSARGDDFHDALIGMVQSAPPDTSPESESLTSIEIFLRACEAKGDYSYVYVASKREAVPGRRWRPTHPGPLRTPIMWHSYGKGQSGALFETHVRLNDLAFLHRGPVGPTARASISAWLGIEAVDFDLQRVIAAVHRRLRDAGFTGDANAVETNEGIVVLQDASDFAEGTEMAVPLEVRWVHGAPALLIQRLPIGLWEFRDVGVFVGVVPATGHPIDIA